MNNAPLLTVTHLQRELWLSHWGSNVAAEEHYYVRHDGAQLKGQFSRVDYALNQMQHHQTQVVNQLKIELPAMATDVYYYDDIGNVSTSHLRPASKFSSKRRHALLELQPRYPLYGGWRYTWFQGYNVPLSEMVRLVNGRHVLQADFLRGFADAAYDNVTLKVVLPEGARDIRVDTVPVQLVS